MASLNDIRSHIQSVQKTRKITNAMYLVSSSRMRKAIRNIEQNRAYFYRAYETMRDVRRNAAIQHPYLQHRDKDVFNTAYIVIAGEKGLSGSYNHDVLALADESVKEHDATHIFTIGDVATAHFRRKGIEVNENFAHIAEAPSINTARRLTHIIMDLYDSGEIDELRVVYTRFINSITHKPTDIQMLPIELDSFDVNERVDEDITIYDPSPEEVFHELVPQFIIGYIYGALVNSYACENFARRNAMESATKSADEMIEKLKKQYNTARQLTITNEISEIVGAANATKTDNK